MTGFDNTIELNNQKYADALYEARDWPYLRRDYRKYNYDLECRNRPTEEKYRLKDYGDLLVELIQCVRDANWGWFFSENFEVLHYFVGCALGGETPPETLHMVNWRVVKPWLFDYWASGAGQTRFSDKGYGLTLNIAVPWDTLPPKSHHVIRVRDYIE